MYQEKICLLIDDDHDDQEFFHQALKTVSPSTRLVIAPNAMTAMKMLREESLPNYIFLDLYLPGIDGYEFLLHLKRDIKHRRIPVIIYSQLDDQSQITHAKKLGASDFFTKTYHIYELEALLKKYITD